MRLFTIAFVLCFASAALATEKPKSPSKPTHEGEKPAAVAAKAKEPAPESVSWDVGCKCASSAMTCCLWTSSDGKVAPAGCGPAPECIQSFAQGVVNQATAAEKRTPAAPAAEKMEAREKAGQKRIPGAE